MSKEDKIVPPLRFPDFCHGPDWVVKPLNSLADRVNERNRGLRVSRVLTNSASDGVVNQRDYFHKDIADKSKIGNYLIVRKGDYVYNPRVSVSAPVGPISKNKCDMGVMSPLYSVFRFENEVEDFFEQYFKSTYWHGYLYDVSNTGARHDRMSLTNDEFMAMPLPCPMTEDEQRKISDCLSSIDDVIELEKQKLEALRDHKKGLLQKFFCKQHDDSVFATTWTHAKLGDVATVIAGQSPKAESYNKEGIGTPFMQGKKDYGDKFPTPTIWTKSVSKLAESGDILMSVRAPVGALNIANQRICIGRGLAAIRATDKISCRCLFYALLQISEDLEGDSGSIFNSINKKQIEKINFILSPPSEQKRIVATLDSVDDVIELEKQRLEALHDHKKGLLQQLFPNIEALTE